jgi:hypothetical protein
VLDCREHSRGDERERAEERDRIAVGRSNEAVQPVPAEPGAPVDERLEVSECERGGGEEDQSAHDQAAEPQRRDADERIIREQRTLAHAQRCEPDRRGREHQGGCDRRDRDHRERRPAGLVLQHRCERRGREGVGERSRDEDDEPSGKEPRERA